MSPPGRYALAPSLRHLLDEVLAEVRERTGFEEGLVAVARLEGHAVGTAVDVPRGEVDAFVDALLRAEPDTAPPTDALTSLRCTTLIPVDTPAGRFTAVFVVEAEPNHPQLSSVRNIVRAAAPFLNRLAELHVLRSKVAGMQSRQLRSSRALDAMPDPVLVTDAASRILLANRRAEELLITGSGDNRGRRRAVETNNLFFSAFRAREMLKTDGGSAGSELLLVDPIDGSDLLFEVFVLPFHDSAEFPEGSIYVLRDITDLKQMTHELEVQYGRSVAAEHGARRESERLNVIIGNAGVPIFVTDRQTNITMMNREAERLLGSKITPGASSRAHDVRANDAKLAGFINEFLLQQGLRCERQLVLVDPDQGRSFPVLAVSTKILGEHSEPTAMVTVLHDLTQEVENRHLAEELRRLNAQLEERVVTATYELAQRNRQLEEQRATLVRASRMKSEFLATMSHELRTPINAVLGYNSLLRDGLFGELTDRQGDALERMRNAAQDLLSIINDILDLSRVEAGKIHVSATDIDLRSFLEKLSETVRPMASQEDLDYLLDIAPDAPAIRTDVTRLRQVLLNLLSNAVKFTDAGSVTLRASPTEDERLRLEVIDTGIGIAAEDLERIFEEFTQADQSATRKHGGTGLGLAISRRLIRVMGGALSVASEVGSGSTFRVELPLVPPMTWGDAATPELESSTDGLPEAMA